MRSFLLRNRLNCRLLAAFLLSLTCFYSSAQASDNRVTINGSEIPLKAVFKAIKKQTGFAVMYNTNITMLNQEEKVTVSFNNTPLEDVLTFLLKGRNLAWTYNDDVVVIHKKIEEAPKKNEVIVDSAVTPALLTGKVTDAAGSPLPGVTVQVKGTNQGTTTDADGRFTLAKVKNGETLVISSIGYEKREIVVRGRSILTQMNLDISKLDETVIIAYGTTTQRLSTGNISTIKIKEIEGQPISNPLLFVQGRVPGVFITQANGIPGGGITVRIQGQNSIRNGSDPLYIIDGVPLLSQLPSTGGFDNIFGTSGGTAIDGVFPRGNPLNYINPADIESIDILKDGDATAIYGSRAANGAILITTKKGRTGKSKFNADVQNGWGNVTRTLNVLNTEQYIQMRKEAKKNDNTAILPTDYDINGFWNTTRYTDWQKELIGNSAKYTNININFSGGTSGIQYLIGGTYHRETTVFPGNFDDQKGSVHFNINSSSENKKFHIQFSGNYSIDNNKLPQTDLTSFAITLEPNAPPLYNHDGTLNWMPSSTGGSTFDNPLRYLNQPYKNKTTNLISNFVVGYKILNNLELRGSGGYTNMQTNDFTSMPLTTIRPENRPYTLRNASYGNRNLNNWIIEPQINYQLNLLNGQLETLVGTTIQQNNSNGGFLYGEGYNSDHILEDIRSAPTLYSFNSFTKVYKYNAIFYRINYNWHGKYILNLTGRRDGSSRFGAKRQFHNFGSIGAAWLFSEGRAFQKIAPLLSFGKLKASYGITGSDQIGDYAFMNLYNPIGVDVAYQGIIGLRPSGLPNPYLEWEKTKKLNIGLDLGFLSDKILFSANFSQNRSSNQLLPYSLPSTAGFDGIIRNFPATIQNRTWEFSLNLNNTRELNFQWTTSINLTIPQNKLLSFDNLSTSPYATSLVIGQPLGIIKVYPFKGVDPQTGNYQYSDLKGDITQSPNYLNDRSILINTMPKFYGGLQNTFRYKSLQLSFLFQFTKQTGPNIFFFNGSSFPGQFYSGTSNQPVTVLNRWQNPGDITTIKRFSDAWDNNVTLSEYNYSDASYIRLKNLSLSYSVPPTVVRKAHLNNCKVYFQAQNLLTITSYKGLDPESNSIFSLPPLKTLTLGLMIEL